MEKMGNQEKMDRKSESLRKWNGDPADFVVWAEHVTDHMHRVQPTWRVVLNWLGKTDEFIWVPATQYHFPWPFR